MAFTGTLGEDYSFVSGFYLNAGYLYNSLGVPSANILELFSFELTAKNLYPYRHAMFLQESYPISPLIGSGMAIIYSPGSSHAVFLNPSLTLSIKENWDLDVVGQLVFNRSEKYTSPSQSIFLRLKYSY